MSRPTKAVVDYFPLDCQFGDSIDALEDIYGNDAFVIWIKTLQKLGRSENHFVDIRKSKQWKLFYSKFRMPEQRVREILEEMADLGCIDKELWEKGLIYSENFVKRIADAYRHRKISLMSKDEIFEKFILNTDNPHEPQIFPEDNPQIKIKEDKNKEEEQKNFSAPAENFLQKSSSSSSTSSAAPSSGVVCGLYKNVFLSKEELHQLEILCIDKNLPTRLIEELSLNIAQGKENAYISRGYGHAARLNAYFKQYQRNPDYIKSKTVKKGLSSEFIDNLFSEDK